MTGLYLHIPFCSKKCHYCDFVVTILRDLKTRESFFLALEKEALHYQPVFEKTVFETLYMGGGTPSVLESSELEKIFFILKRTFAFKKDAEITVEANPGDIDEQKASALHSLGANRISLGVQSFHDDTLKKINRSHNREDILRSFEILRQAGFKNISVDLILSLPGEGLPQVKTSLEQVFKMNPEHISLYELVVEEKTFFGSLAKKGKLLLPPEEAQTQILSYAREALQEKGYRHYELLSYAKPGFESRHNLLYWANQEYLGLGPGAFSYVDGRRFRNSKNVRDYFSKSQARDWGAAEEETLSEQDKETESFLLALRLMEGVPAKRFQNFILKNKTSLKDLEAKGLLVTTDSQIKLSDRGQLFAETVFSELSNVLQSVSC